MRKIVFLAAFFAGAAAIGTTDVAAVGLVYAQESVDAAGLDGREVTAVTFSQMDPDVLFVGTQDGLFVKDITKRAAFRRVRGVPFESCRVNEIRSYAYSRDVLAATERGLFVVDTFTLKARQVFGRSDRAERACVSAVRLEDGVLVVSTRAGLFVRRSSDTEWSRLPVPFEDAVAAELFGTGQVIYAAVPEGVYRSVDAGQAQAWEKVFDAGAAAEEIPQEASSDASDDEETSAGPERKVVDIAGLEAEPGQVCVATTSGVFQTRDGGGTWQALPLSGLDYASVRRVFIHPVLREVLCLTRTGLYLKEGAGWVELARIFEGRSITGFGTVVLYATKTGLYTLDPLVRTQIPAAATGTVPAAAFIHEPTIEEVQRMATDYAEVSNDKIKDWRRRASLRAFMPDLTLGYDKTVYGSSSGAFAVGPTDWGVSLQWELGDLVYNEHQTSIDTRSKLMVQLRNDILAEVTRLYFERRKIQIEMAESDAIGKERIDKELRLQELTALINRLTGGYFTKVLKSLY